MSDARDNKPLSPKAQAAIAALDYASPSLRAAAEGVPAAEAALDRRGSIRAAARGLGKPSTAAISLRHALVRRHSIANAGDACVGCGATTSGVIGVRWSFVVPIRYFRSLIGERAAIEAVETHHAMCAACAARPFERQRRARRLTGAAVVAGVGLLAAAVYGFMASKGELLARAMLFLGAAAVLASLGLIWAAKWFARQSVPRALRRSMPSWLTFEAWQGWFDRAISSSENGRAR